MFDDMDLFMVNGSVPEGIEVTLAGSWVVDMDRVRDLVEVQAHEHRTQA